MVVERIRGPIRYFHLRQTWIMRCRLCEHPYIYVFTTLRHQLGSLGKYGTADVRSVFNKFSFPAFCLLPSTSLFLLTSPHPYLRAGRPHCRCSRLGLKSLFWSPAPYQVLFPLFPPILMIQPRKIRSLAAMTFQFTEGLSSVRNLENGGA